MAFFKWKKKDDEEKKADYDTAKVEGGKKGGQAKSKDKQATGSKSMKDLYSESGKEIKVAGKDGKSVKKQKQYGQAYKTLIKPLVTEKAANLGAHNQYVFEVSPKANKIEVAKAIDEVYGIKPVSVNIIKIKGKRVNYGRYKGKRRDWKKAVVTLPSGKTINIYEGV